MRVAKLSFVPLQRNLKFFQLYPNGHLFFYSEIETFKTVPKGHLFFDNEIQNFQNCTEMAILFSKKQIQNLIIYYQFSYVP